MPHKKGEFLMKKRVTRHVIIQQIDQSIKLIPLTQGYNCIIDSVDYDFVNQWNWAANIGPDGRVYARRSAGKQKIFMHRLLTNFEGEHTDHKDGDGLNNRR